jgi:LuxR family maltose regulon positive regulatory protein
VEATIVCVDSKTDVQVNPQPYFLTLLQTRLQPPLLPADITARPRLNRLMQRGAEHKLLLVTAPAGYGKTTAVLGWVQQQPQPTAWLALDAATDDLNGFVVYVVAAVQRVAPDACTRTATLVEGGQAPAAVLLAALVNELAGLTQRIVLVLDDYDSVAAGAVHEFMAALIDALPPTMRVIMTCRASPPLPLARWRGRGDLAEIRAADLRSDENETPALLAAMIGAPLSPAVVDAIQARTEGWVTGLRLAALSLQRSDPAQLLAAFEQAGSASIRDYLLDEVLQRQPEAVQRFLLTTSILDRCCAPLCATLLHGEGVSVEAELASRAMLDRVTAAGLFVTLLDEAGEWRRYHPLFAELLRLRLQHLVGAGRVAALHCAAGRWFAGQGLVDAAIHHLLAGGNVAAAVDVVAAQFQPALNREEWPQLERWLALLPAAEVASHPVLLLARAWCEQLHFAVAAIPPLLARFDALLPALTPADADVLAGRAASLHAFVLLMYSDPAAALAQTEISLREAPADDRYPRSIAALVHALALHMVGRGEEAESWLLDLLRAARGRVDAFTIRLRYALCTNYRAGGELAKLRAAANQMLKDAQAARLPIGEGWGHTFLGHDAYERNELAEAESHYVAGVRLMYVAHAAAVRECLFGLTLTQIAQRRFDDAAATVARLREFRAASLDPESDSLAARLALVQGDHAAALRWANSFRPGALLPFLHWQEIPALTAVRVLAVSGQEEGLRRALDLLEPLAAWAERSHCTLRVAECMALAAVALDRLGRTQAADEALRTALHLGEEAGYRRTLLDIGPRLQPLLMRQTRRKATAALARLLLRALVDESGQMAPPAAPTGEYVETLTPRETEVLMLLARRYTNKEIAQELVIAPNTVKRHTLQIFAKLGANDRRAAVERAQQLGLLRNAS